MRYRRSQVKEGSFFFTVNLADRSSDLLIKHINELRSAINRVRTSHPFEMVAFVVLPEHLHCIWRLLLGDKDYPMRWSLIKAGFSRCLPVTEHIRLSRVRKRERGIWQRRYWEHQIRDAEDMRQHIDYIHYNPVKHGHVNLPIEWPFSSLHRYIRCKQVPTTWGAGVGLSGGNCGRGAAAAFLSEVANQSGFIEQPKSLATWGAFRGTVEAGLVGGAASEITGGGFSDGFSVAAAGYLFNDAMHTYEYKVTISSNAYEDDYYSRGHVWITTRQSDGSVINTYGLYPSWNSEGAQLEKGSDVYTNPDGTYTANVSWIISLTADGYKSLMAFVNTPALWSSSYTCANWAVDAIKAATWGGSSWLNAHDNGWFNIASGGTPRAVTGSIYNHDHP